MIPPRIRLLEQLETKVSGWRKPVLRPMSFPTLGADLTVDHATEALFGDENVIFFTTATVHHRMAAPARDRARVKEIATREMARFLYRDVAAELRHVRGLLADDGLYDHPAALRLNELLKVLEP